MYKTLSVLLIIMLFMTTGCEEDPMVTNGTAPRIGFAFFIDGEPVIPDSVFTSQGKRVFEDSMAIYKLPLNIHETVSHYLFHVDSLSSEIYVEYELKLEEDIDRLRYNAYNPAGAYTNLDSLLIGCADTITCNTNEAVFFLYF